MTIQQLLDEEADLGNKRYAIHQKIKEMRGDNPPRCYGEDDCSSSMLVVCPWRIDCGESR